MLKISEEMGCTSRALYGAFKKYGFKCRNDREKSLRYSINENYFETIDTQDKAYFLGWMYSDGYITRNKFGISLKVNDKDILEEFKKYMNSTHEIRIYTNSTGYGGTDKYPATTYARLLVTSPKMVEDLISHGVVYRKTKILKAPNIREDLIRHFIRGYLDGDGSVYVSQNTLSVSFVGTEEVLNYIGNYFVNAGLTETFRLHNEKHSESVKCLRFGGNIKVPKMLDELYEDAYVFLKRKNDVYMNFMEKSS